MTKNEKEDNLRKNYRMKRKVSSYKTVVRICKKIESEMAREYKEREILGKKKLSEINKLNR